MKNPKEERKKERNASKKPRENNRTISSKKEEDKAISPDKREGRKYGIYGNCCFYYSKIVWSIPHWGEVMCGIAGEKSNRLLAPLPCIGCL